MGGKGREIYTFAHGDWVEEMKNNEWFNQHLCLKWNTCITYIEFEALRSVRVWVSLCVLVEIMGSVTIQQYLLFSFSWQLDPQQC